MENDTLIPHAVIRWKRIGADEYPEARLKVRMPREYGGADFFVLQQFFTSRDGRGEWKVVQVED